jgi:hypothetical protein
MKILIKQVHGEVVNWCGGERKETGELANE